MSDRNRRRLAPAVHVIDKFTTDAEPGVKVLAQICGVDQSRVYRWMYGVEYGGTGGAIPQRHHMVIMAASKQRKISLSPGELLGFVEAA